MASIWNTIGMLLGANPDLRPEGADGVIEVVGRKPTGQGGDFEPPAPRAIGNRSYLEEALQASENAPQRKGMFGIKGTLRDIVGTLGDAFLVQSGANPLYRPQRQREMESDALVGFTSDPKAAMERLANINPEAALDLFKNQAMAQYRDATSERQQANLERQITNDTNRAKFERIKLGVGMFGNAKTPEEQQLIRHWINDPEASLDDLPPHLLSGAGMTAYQTTQVPLNERKTRVAERNASSNEVRAARPPQPRAAPQPTAASIAAPIFEKIRAGKEISPGEEATLSRLGFSPGKGQRKGGIQRPGAAAPSPTRSRPQPGQVIRSNGKLYRVGSDGKTLSEVK